MNSNLENGYILRRKCYYVTLPIVISILFLSRKFDQT